GQPLHHREQRHEIAVDTARFATGQLGHVRVLFLGHDAAAGRDRVVQLDESELGRVPEDDLLSQAAQVHADEGGGGQELNDVIAIRDRIHAIGADAVETEELRYPLAIDRVGGP